jgi:chemotaxis protein MotB
MLTTKASKGKRGDHATGHGWFVTFADLMSLLMCYFAMMLAFSQPDRGKMAIVAGSMREAFGVKHEARYAGVIELDGLPTRGKVAHVDHVSPEHASGTPGADGEPSTDVALAAERNLLRASSSLRHALQDAPDLAAISKSLMWEDTPQGVNMQITDQEGRPMFADGSSVLTAQMQRLIERMAAPLKATSLRISITGHTAAGGPPGQGYRDAYDLAWDRANAVRQILAREGFPNDRLFLVASKGDSEPLFPDTPSAAANRRVTITLIRESPSLPPNLKP